MRNILAMAGLAVMLSAGPGGTVGSDGEPPVRTTYDLFLGGVKAGELRIDADFEDQSYRATSVLKTAGIVGMVYKASFEAETQGRLQDGRLVPDRFAAASRMKAKQQYVEMTYRGASPVAVVADPAFVPKPWQIEPAQQDGTLDPISAALSALAPGPTASICNQSVEVFDGRRRYAIDLGTPEADGARIRCPAVYRRIAGFKPKMMKKSPSFPFNVWYAERADGLAHVVRAAGTSMFGLAVVLLRE